MTTRTTSILSLLGGVLMVGGSFLPWISARSGFGTVSVTGIEGDGIGTLIAGVLVALIGLVYWDRVPPRAARMLVILSVIIGAAVVVVDFQDVQSRVTAFDSDTIVASVGPGLFVVGLGVLLAFIGSVVRPHKPQSDHPLG